MIKPPINLQDLRRRIYCKAKSDKTHRFWGIFVHIANIPTLREAYERARRNGGAPGIDGQSFADIESIFQRIMAKPEHARFPVSEIELYREH